MRRDEGHLPPPPPSVLSSASAPALSKDARRGSCHIAAPRPGLAAVAPHPCPCSPGRAKTPARASRGLPPHFSGSRWISSSSYSNRPRGRPEKRSDSPTASTDPALAQPKIRGARGPTPNAPLPEAGARVSAVPRRRRRHSPRPQLPSARGVGGVAGWRMLLPTEGRGRNGNRNHGRRLTEPPAPLTEGEREAARAGQ